MKGRGHKRRWESLRQQCRSDPCERRGGRKEGWAGEASDFNAASEKFSAGLIGSWQAGCALEEHHVGQEWLGSSMSAVLSQTGRRTEIA